MSLDSTWNPSLLPCMSLPLKVPWDVRELLSSSSEIVPVHLSDYYRPFLPVGYRTSRLFLSRLTAPDVADRRYPLNSILTASVKHSTVD